MSGPTGPTGPTEAIVAATVSESGATDAAGVAGHQIAATVNSTHRMLPERDLGNYRVPLQELRRIKDAVRDIRDRPEWLKIGASGFAFLAPAFFLAAYLWGPAFDALPPQVKPQYAPYGGNLLIAGIACVVLAIGLFIAHVSSGSVKEMGKDHAIDLIENLEDRFVSPGGD